MIKFSWFIVYCFLCLSTFHTLPSDSCCGLNPPSRQPFIHPLLQGGAAVGMDFDKTPSAGITGAETCAFDEDAATFFFFQKLHLLGGGFNVFSQFNRGNDRI